MNQLVMGPTQRETTHGLVCSRMSEPILSITAEDCDRHDLYFAFGGVLDLNKVKQSTKVPPNFIHSVIPF